MSNKKPSTVVSRAEHERVLANNLTHKQILEAVLAHVQQSEHILKQVNESQCAELLAYMNKEQAWTAKQAAFENLIKAQEECLKEINNKLSESKANYEHRHNHCLKADADLRQVRSELHNEKFQYATFKSEVARLLMLQLFPGGLQQELMLTRCRNRILAELVPVPEGGPAECQIVDASLERPPTPQEIEQAK